MLVKTSLINTLRQSTIKFWPSLLFAAIYSFGIFRLYDYRGLTFMSSFGFMPIGFVITALSVFMGFRNNIAYTRWWEARTACGNMVNLSRTLAVQLAGFLDQEVSEVRITCEQIIYRHLAFVNLLRMHLRDQLCDIDKVPYLNSDDAKHIAGMSSPAVQLLIIQGEQFSDLHTHKLIDSIQLANMMQTLKGLHDIYGACERIKNTPFPQGYDALIYILNSIFVLLFPIYLLSVFSDDLSKLLIVPITVIAVFVLEFANRVGQNMENPFENLPEDVPMSQLCNTIERDLLQSLKIYPIPDKLQPVQGVLN